MKRRLWEYCEDYAKGDDNEDIILQILNNPQLPVKELRTAIMYLLKDARELNAFKQHVWYLRRLERRKVR